MYPANSQYKTFSFYTENAKKALALKKMLKTNNIWYEPSECGDGIYFSIRCTKEQRIMVDDFLDRL